MLSSNSELVQLDSTCNTSTLEWNGQLDLRQAVRAVNPPFAVTDIILDAQRIRRLLVFRHPCARKYLF